MKTLISVPLFSIPVCISNEVYNMSSVELNFIKNLKGSDHNESNTVTENQYILELPELNNLKKWIQEYINTYFFEFLKVKDIDEIYITQSWSNTTKKGKNHYRHNHPNSVVSGVMHFEDDDASLNFYSNNKYFPFEFNYKEYDPFNSERWSWPTKKYKLFLFPSTINHDVDTQEINRDRISLSFNTWVRGSVGNESSSTSLIIK
jgi:uncharacterized protein (TIGR02466 family)|tara:strand:+ start:395 stop:1006 length:612 start_codon:yes stop_codon:yes gene_type:complete